MAARLREPSLAEGRAAICKYVYWRVTNPPQVGNLPHTMSSYTHAALRVDFCAANMPLANSSAMPNAAVTTRLSTAPG